MEANSWSTNRAAVERVLAQGAPLGYDLIEAIIDTQPDYAFVTGCGAKCSKQSGARCILYDSSDRRIAISKVDAWDRLHATHSAGFEAHEWYEHQICPFVAPDDLPIGYGASTVRMHDENRYASGHKPRLQQRLWFAGPASVVLLNDVGQPRLTPTTVRAVPANASATLLPMERGNVRDVFVESSRRLSSQGRCDLTRAGRLHQNRERFR